MKLTVLGARGSFPSPSYDGFSTSEFGGNTTCFLIESGGKKYIVDAGSGMKVLARRIGKQPEQNYTLFFTHLHEDHTNGFKFFGPAYNPKNKIEVCGPEGTETSLRTMQENPRFPVPLHVLEGVQEFHEFYSTGRVYEDDIVTVDTHSLNHPGGSISYKFTDKQTGLAAVIATDFEPNGDSGALARWFGGAQLVLADAQYEVGSDKNPFMKGWGHSDYKTDIDLAARAGVERLILTHHEPEMNDDYLRGLESRAREYAYDSPFGFVGVDLAREGETYTVGSSIL